MSTLITNIGELVTNAPEAGAPGVVLTGTGPAGTGPAGTGLTGPGLFAGMRDAALITEDGRVAWTGPAAHAPAADEVVDAGGRAVLPGFVDSHAHLVFAGERGAEFAARMAGRPYLAGGIRSTVAATRTATDQELLSNLRNLAGEMLAQGTTTFECKSGYGLTTVDEQRSVALAAEVTSEVTYLGAHVVPPEFAEDPAGYVRLVCGEMLAACAPHARWVDVFCERGAFGPDEAAAVLAAGSEAGLQSRVHANQLGEGPGVQLAVAAGAASADHCTYLSDADVDALASSETVATLAARRRVLHQAALPGCAAAAGRGRHGRDRHRLQSGLLFHLKHGAVHRAGGAGDADDDRAGGLGGHRGRRSGAAPDRRRPSWCRRPRRPGHAGLRPRMLTLPTGRASRWWPQSGRRVGWRAAASPAGSDFAAGPAGAPRAGQDLPASRRGGAEAGPGRWRERHGGRSPSWPTSTYDERPVAAAEPDQRIAGLSDVRHVKDPGDHQQMITGRDSLGDLAFQRAPARRRESGRPNAVRARCGTPSRSSRAPGGRPRRTGPPAPAGRPRAG